MDNIINFINNLSPSDWQLVLAGVLAAPVTQVVKRGLEKLHDKELKSHWAWLLAVGISALGSVGVYLLNVPEFKPSVAALHTAYVQFAATPIYYVFIKGLWQNLILSSFTGSKIQHQLKSAEVPAGGLPLEAEGAVNPLAQPSDFS